MASTPYSKAYTENLIAALERTRQELKDIMVTLTDEPTLRQMHRMAASITDDLEA